MFRMPVTAAQIWCKTCGRMRPTDHVRLDELTDPHTGQKSWIYVCADPEFEDA